jgi:uncharacterized protein (TIGR04255 family)
MAEKKLKHPPLVEVILEAKWKLQPDPIHLGQKDPSYSLLVGRLHDRISGDFPYHEALPAAEAPDELTPYVVKHRFRAAEDAWPLVQVGPGIISLNQTQDYSTFAAFLPRAAKLIKNLYAAYPAQLEISSLVLRYIDAVEFDWSKESIYDFLAEKMGIPLGFPDKLFEDTCVERRPDHLRWQSAFACHDPEGTASIGFATGEKEGRRALIWDQIVASKDASVPGMPAGFEQWLRAAHAVNHTWFMKLIEGELEERFSK